MSHSDPHTLGRSRLSRTKLAALALLSLGALLTQAGAAQPQFVAAQGRVLPTGGIIHVAASQDGGTPVVGTLKVSVGDQVKLGAPLAKLTTLESLQTAVAEARAQAETTALRLSVATPNAIKVAQARAAATDADVQLAQAGVAEALAAQDAAEKTLIEATSQFQAQQARLSGNWAENKRILDNDGPPAREAAQLRFEQKMLDLQKAELATSNAGTTLRLQAQIEQAKAAVQTAKQRVANAKAAQQIALAEVRNAEAGTAIAKAENAVAALAVSRAEQLARTATILSPINGTVLQINARAGEAVSPEGLLLIANLETLYVEAEVYIDDLRHVSLGQKARITGEAFAGEITGTVERIGQMVTLPEIFARDPAAFTDQRVVKVRVRLDKSTANGDALPALPVNSRVLVRIDR